MIPSAGPPPPMFKYLPAPPPPRLSVAQRRVLDYARRQAPGARITLAVEGGAMSATPFILDSGATVIGMGGFTATDNAPSTAQLQRWTTQGELRYILVPGASRGFSFGASGGPVHQRTTWTSGHCVQVPAAAFGESDSALGGFLYDCARSRSGNP
jgi:hypothetical protein